MLLMFGPCLQELIFFFLQDCFTGGATPFRLQQLKRVTIASFPTVYGQQDSSVWSRCQPSLSNRKFFFPPYNQQAISAWHPANV